MARRRDRVLLAQLPIPPVGPGPIKGNVPLAAAYLALYAQNHDAAPAGGIEILAPESANTLSDAGLADEILGRAPDLVGLSCYVWNSARTLDLARALKARDPGIAIAIGGPEVTPDNRWLLDDPAIDYAVMGEGEQTFAALLASREDAPEIDGLFVRGKAPVRTRKPLADLSEVGSPYLAGILDARDERMMLVESMRGCAFACKFCYYPKSYDKVYSLPDALLAQQLAHARARDAREVILLDPTLNQRRDFGELVRVLASANPDRRFTYFGELRAEGLTPAIAQALHAAGFDAVEVGLQSVEPVAQKLMDRSTYMKAYERGIAALLDAGIAVTVDLIVGLPGDTVDSIRRGFDYLAGSKLYTDVQVFQLAVLPGTAFRHEAQALGLVHQPTPPYYCTASPTLSLDQIVGLVDEAQGVFDREFDPLPPPVLDSMAGSPGPLRLWRVDLDRDPVPPEPARHAQAFVLWMRTVDLARSLDRACALVRAVLAACPHTTLELVLDLDPAPAHIDPAWLDRLLAAATETPSYLDRFYALLTGRAIGAKRIVLRLPGAHRARWTDDELAVLGERATFAWTRPLAVSEDELWSFEHVCPSE